MSKNQHDKKQFVNQYMAQKAGMQEVDKEKITDIIAKLTQGSPKSLYQKQMNQKRQIQLAQMLRKTLQFSPEQKKQMKQSWIPQIQKMNQNRPLNKFWAHLDFDMFYVACQMLQKPQLKDKPCAVGGQFSVICTANYIARKYGVRSALPTFIAKKLCSQLILIPPDFTKYKKFSNIFRDVLRRYDKDLESMGLDQAYVQLTDYLWNKNLDEQEKFINQIRYEIFNQTGLTVSCGVGANKMLAKLASQEKKPNGQYILQNSEQKILQFMSNKKIRKIPGIGPVNQFFLKGLGIQNAKDILQNTDILSICFSSNSTEFYISAALGLGQTEHEFVQRKSLGKSQTFKPTGDLQFLFQKIYQICEQVSMQLQQLGYVSKNIIFCYQNQTFLKKDKTFQLSKYTSVKQQLIQPILPYLQNYLETKKQKIRLLGVRCTSILKIQELRKIQIDKYLIRNGGSGDDVIEGSSGYNGKQKCLIQQPISNFFCPICNGEINCKGNLAAFNRHIDKCMVGQERINQEQNKPTKESGDLNQNQKKNIFQIKSNSQHRNVQKINKNEPKSQKNKNQKVLQQKGSLLSFFKKGNPKQQS